MIEIKNAYYRGAISIDSKVSGSGIVQGYSWCLSSTSTTLIIEIAEDPAIDRESLPLVGYGCGGWIFEQPFSQQRDYIMSFIDTAMMLFRDNKMTYFPAVTCSCSDL
ncbi:hypothetical protein GLP30_11730 [Photobacterium phosphoreum]|jgi:hypothetical protein|uniref:Uncharacterized protein n=1 Tax=Photobacterium phosphoreum TaxID=659 RepID=A0AAW4ZV76_PHOPO|nr:hypothetical protein [Photobacterium phosphoreum]MCD9463622.1 hypothetical protein [Photobacterium phosphoreum]MCD9491409.1 hypothetical protein [Photobacterium phosphoreum]MCD9504703.1 hypothetical protein [Photobacterium phosphoreum]MCF2190755.1 hypothetical protein [Photobacterium phosphoreum]MCF2302318.1 hypothetical protein [Photobacterium phosphoreum]